MFLRAARLPLPPPQEPTAFSSAVRTLVSGKAPLQPVPLHPEQHSKTSSFLLLDLRVRYASNPVGPTTSKPQYYLQR